MNDEQVNPNGVQGQAPVDAGAPPEAAPEAVPIEAPVPADAGAVAGTPIDPSVAPEAVPSEAVSPVEAAPVEAQMPAEMMPPAEVPVEPVAPVDAQIYPEAAPVGMDATAQMSTEATAPVETPVEQAPVEQAPVEQAPAPEVVAPVEVPAAPEAQAVPEQAATTDDKKAAKKAGGLNEKMQKFSEWFKTADFKTLFAEKEGKNLEETSESFEINLVPAVKAEALRATRLRNFILFICLVIVGVVGGGVAILGTTYGAQSLTIAGHDKQINDMSAKINSFEGLEGFLAIQDQLDGVGEINEKKQVLSRVFTIVGAMQPSAPDKITLSEMVVDLEEDTISLKGYADAGASPWIDYNVLQAYKKTIEEMKYDYGSYVDKNGEEIPMRCMVENGQDGDTLTSDSGEYAYWMVTKNECDKKWTERAAELKELDDEIAIAEMEAKNSEDNKNNESENGEDSESDTQKMSEEEIKNAYKEIYDKYKGGEGEEGVVETWYDKWLSENNLTRYTDKNLTDAQLISKEAAWEKYYGGLSEEEKWVATRMIEGNGVAKEDVYLEKVYRTPQYADWYDGGESDDSEATGNYMALDGTISGVPHFESKCIKYTGYDTGNEVRWESENECRLVDEEVTVSNSSNARDSDGALVVTFELSMNLNSEVLKFVNKHVMAVRPGVKNVTGSYTQIQQMFGEAAKDCQSSDVECVQKKANEGGETPTTTPTPTPTATPIATPTATPSLLPDVTTLPTVTPKEEE